MAEIVNLSRARKAKAKAEKGKMAEANRVKHGTPKHLRNLTEARKDRANQSLSGHKLEKDSDDNRSVGEVPSNSVGTNDQK